MRKADPFGAFNFIVEIEGLQVAGFSEITGIQTDIEIEEFREGGINQYVHKLAKVTKYPNLVLKKGMTDASELWGWHKEVIEGTIVRRDVTVILGDKKEKKWSWLFSQAYPVKWIGTDLNATGSNVFVESIEFVHHGMIKS